jgi:hypothetical protein
MFPGLAFLLPFSRSARNSGGFSLVCAYACSLSFAPVLVAFALPFLAISLCLSRSLLCDMQCDLLLCSLLRFGALCLLMGPTPQGLARWTVRGATLEEMAG